MSRSTVTLFNALAESYDEHFEVPHRRAYDELAWERTVAMLPSSPGVVIDAGCGNGRWARRFIELGHQVVGIEQAPAMAAEARRLNLGPSFRLVERRMEDAELPDACADLVVAAGSLQFTDEPREMIRRFARWVRRGGGVCVLVDSLVALVLELLRAGRDEEAVDRVESRRGVWSEAGAEADVHLLDRVALEHAFQEAGLVGVRAAGLLVGASAFGRAGLVARLHSSWDEQLDLERRLASRRLLADVGKQLFVAGRRPL